ncbi:unnamed protein product [Cylicocyclus nassatus]|uniref:Uncharacterized protein n=1 Tax=Cylicocyclus nassatus TaxID=53992 RepID=A0AA36M6A0_CYLNA|nr:unnamed protein product [Cylicocyclus nassatus]
MDRLIKEVWSNKVVNKSKVQYLHKHIEQLTSMLRIIICLLALFAWTYADFDTWRSCNTTKKRLRWADDFKPNGTELNAFNEALGVYLSKHLDFFDLPTHLHFDCILAGSKRYLNIVPSFDLVQTHTIAGKYNISSHLEDFERNHFIKIANEVLTKLLKYTRKKRWYDCFTSCFRDRAVTVLFGCDYIIRGGSEVVFKCAFEKRKKLPNSKYE